jgi:hypothetical protein
MSGKNAVLAVVTLLLAAQAVADTADTAEQRAESVTLAAGKVVEPCVALQRLDRLEFEFTAAAPVDFNLHYHVGEKVEFPVNQQQVETEKGVFVAPEGRNYCLMWTNKSKVDLSLSYQYKVYREAPAQ